MIRHEAIAQNAHKDFGLSFCQNFFERGIVSVILENPIPGISTVEYVKDHPPLAPGVLFLAYPLFYIVAGGFDRSWNFV
ncbi:MAG: hypothetical protein WCH39_09685 [Schlesneria sp.]